MGTNARPEVPILIESLKDKEQRFATLAAIGLGHMKLEPTSVVPALLERLQYPGEVRLWAAIALGRFGEEARAAVPALVKMLNDPDQKTKEFASDALRKIDPSALERATR